MRDLTRYYYPAKQILRSIVLEGEFPYWNRLFAAGQPIAANPEHEVFYPLTWLILLPSYDLGFRLQILLHVWIGLVGMYALLRSMDLTPWSSGFGALAWGLGGLTMSYINLLPILFCAAWLPLTCLYVRRFLIRRNVRDFALGSLFLGMQFLVGEPTTVMQTGFLLGMYALYRAWYTKRRVMKAASRVLWVAAISVCGLLIGAAQILPALDHVRDSARSRPFGLDLVGTWSMPWAKFSELLYPNILGHMTVDKVTWYWAGGLYPGMGSPFIFSIYCGILVAALTIGGAFARARGGRLVLVISIVSALFALGSHTPLLKFLYDHGIATAIRYPEKFVMMGVFAMILFASQTLDRMLEGEQSSREGAVGFVAAVALVAIAVSVAAFTPWFTPALTKIWSLTPGPNARFIARLSRWDWIEAAGRAVGALLLLLTIRTRHRRLWLGALFAFVLLDILPIAEEVNPRMPRAFFDAPPLASRLPPNRSEYRIFHEADWYGQEATARKFFSTGKAVYWIVRNGLFPMTGSAAGFATVLERDYDKTALLPTMDLSDAVWDVKRSGRGDWYVPFMAMSNAWYRVEYADFDREKRRVQSDFTKSIPVTLTPSEHYPRYYFADQLVSIRGKSDFAKKLSDGSYSAAVAFVGQPSFVPARGVVHGVRETPNRAELDVESFGQGFLVMSVTTHKYWRIAVDGRNVPAVVTNIAYQGVTLTPGRHRVEMVYSNPLVQIGGGVSSATAAALLLLLAVRRRRQRPDDGPEPYEEMVHVVADAEGTHFEPAPAPEE